MLLALSLVLAASPLDDARRAYADLDYEGCVKTLGTLRAVPAKDRARGELLLGLCHFALGHEGQARTRVESALRRAPSLTAPADASPKEKDFVEEVRAAVAASPPSGKSKKGARKVDATAGPVAEGAGVAVAASPDVAAPSGTVVAAPVDPPDAAPTPAAVAPPPDAPVATSLTPAPPVAPAPIVVAPAPARAPWAPWVAGGVAVAAAGVGVGFGLNARGLESAARAEPVQVEADQLRGQAQTSATVANVAFAVAGTAAVTALVTWLVLR